MFTWDDVKRNGMSTVIRITIPSLHLTHKDYTNKREAEFFVIGFLKRGERKFSEFSRVFRDFSTIFLSIFLFFSPKILIFLQKGGGVIASHFLHLSRLFRLFLGFWSDLRVTI